jgi:hypothetical protein
MSAQVVSFGRVAAAPVSAAVLLLVLVLSIASSLPGTMNSLAREHREDTRLDAGGQTGLFLAGTVVKPRVLDFYRAHLARGDRFFVQAPANGTTSSPDLELTLVAGYALLPAVMVGRPGKADVILSLHANPHALPLRYRHVYTLRPGISVAVVEHAR